MPSDKMSEQTCLAMCRIIWSSIMPCRSAFESQAPALCVHNAYKNDVFFLNIRKITLILRGFYRG